MEPDSIRSELTSVVREIFKRAGRSLDLLQRRIRFSIRASALNPRRPPVLDQDVFRGSRVIVLGPAATVLSDIQDTDVDGFDVIVRLNNGIALALENPQALGSRTDVLFHNLNETGPRHAGEIPPSLLLMHKVRFLVFPHWTFRGDKARLNEKRRELSFHPQPSLVVPPASFCGRVRQRLADHKPTTGISALLYFLECDLKELQVHGFTFFQTPYLAGYNDEVKTDEEAAKWVGASNIHDPIREKAVLLEEIEKARGRGMIVTLGDEVARHLG